MTCAGESHGHSYTVIIDGVPAKIPLKTADFTDSMQRRAPGQSDFTTSRKETDEVQITSGVFEGLTTGAPVCLVIANKDQRSQDYKNLKEIYRPGHGDYVYQQKYQHRDYRGGGRSSARETVCRVAAAVIAQKILQKTKIEVIAFTQQIGPYQSQLSYQEKLCLKTKQIDQSAIRCPDNQVEKLMQDYIKELKAQGDSCGGICQIIAKNVPLGLGEPIFAKLKSDLSAALMSLPAVMGISFGKGFDCVTMKGSEFNDQQVIIDDQVSFLTNHHGGLMAGISSGQPLLINLAVKPPSSIALEQKAINLSGKTEIIKIEGRHDPCLLPRIAPVAQSMVEFVLADHYLLRSPGFN